MKKHNILFIMADQFRWDCIGGESQWVHTPHLNRLAKEGILFNQCITNSPVCVPARVSLATGLYPHNTGIWQNFKHDLEEESRTWMQVIRALGYKTSVFGKTHLHRHEGDLRDREYLMHAYGFDVVNEIGGPRASAKVMSYMTEEWQTLGMLEDYQNDYKERYSNKPYIASPSTLPLNEYADVYVGRKAKEYLQSYEEDKPFFCMMSFGGPHEPWDAPEHYASMYHPKDMPHAMKNVKYNPTKRPNGKLDELISEKPVELSDDDAARLRANYAGNVTLIDEQIGEVLQVLEEKRELDRTIIIFTSDHGEMNGDHGMIYKSNFYDSSVRIPLIIRTPETLKENGGTQYNGFVELMDIGPTLVELAGGEYTYRQFGESLCGVLEDPMCDHRRDAISEIFGEVMIVNHNWKAVVNVIGQVYLLYNRKNDVYEQYNLAGQPIYKEVENELKNRILDRLLTTQVYENIR